MMARRRRASGMSEGDRRGGLITAVNTIDVMQNTAPGR
jgi:hypothetical protein